MDIGRKYEATHKNLEHSLDCGPTLIFSMKVIRGSKESIFSHCTYLEENLVHLRL